MTASRAQMGMEEVPDVWQSPAGQRADELAAENLRLTAEVNALRGKIALAEARAADGVLAKARVAELEEEAGECAQIHERMADLLTRTANILKGAPPPLTLHDWSDLPAVAARLMTRFEGREVEG